MFFSPVDSSSTEPVSFIVQKKATLSTISEELAKQGLIKSSLGFGLLAQLKEIKKPIKVGEYKISKANSPVQILDTLLKGDVIYYDFQLPPGIRVNDLPKLVGESGLLSAKDVGLAIRDTSFISSLGLSGNSFEGYLYPTKYQFSKPLDAKEMLVKMVREGRDNVTDAMIERTIDLGFTYHQIMTLASLIEKTTSRPEERATFASVLHNRLRIGMPLQNDAALRYGFQRPDDYILSEEDLRNPNDYNTYLNTGLPKTPICNPSLESITAALYPADTDYLYYVQRPDMTHEFSSSLREHNKVLSKYRR